MRRSGLTGLPTATKAVALALAMAGTAVLLLSVAGAKGPAGIEVLHLSGEINPGTAAYLDHGLAQAAADGEQAVVVELDTPGGLLTSMRQMVESEQASRLPVIFYVAPSGARAGSAGLWLVEGAAVAAMAPSTNIGASHPVDEGGQLDPVLSAKITNDAVALVRALAQRYGRNPDWAEKAVRDSVSVDDQTALQLHAVDLVAPSLDQLLRAVDGRRVLTGQGHAVLHTTGAPLSDRPMDPLETLLALVSDPNIAYLLFLAAMVGLGFELTHPGAILPGVVGLVSLLLALYALSALPLNLAGLLLVVAALILFVLDLKAAAHGILTAGGVVALAVGAYILLDGPGAAGGLSLFTIGGSSALVLALMALVLPKLLASRRRPVVTGPQVLVGQLGVVREALAPDHEGLVMVGGELWRARAGTELEVGTSVHVVAVEELRLTVARALPTQAEQTAVAP